MGISSRLAATRLRPGNRPSPAKLARDEVELDGVTLAGSFFFGAESPLGPVYLAAGFAEQGERALYLLLGRTF